MVAKWNSEWEKPDPLRGKRGWSQRHYTAVGVSVILFVIAVGVSAPAIERARQKEQELNRAYQQFRAVQSEVSGDPLELR